MLLSLAGLTIEVKNKYEYIEKLAADYELRVPSSLATLEEKEVRFEVVCDKNQMKAVVNEFLKN